MKRIVFAIAVLLSATSITLGQAGSPLPREIATRDQNCAGVWIGPVEINDPTLLSKFDKSLGPVPLRVTVSSCLTLTTAKDRHAAKGNMVGLVHGYKQTTASILAKRGKFLKHLGYWVLSFQGRADINDVEFLSSEKPGEIGALKASVAVGGQNKSGSLYKLGSAVLTLPATLSANQKNLVISPGQARVTELRLLDGSSYFGLTDALATRLVNSIASDIRAETPEEMLLGLTKAKLTLVTSEMKGDDWHFNIAYEVEAPEELLKPLAAKLAKSLTVQGVAPATPVQPQRNPSR